MTLDAAARPTDRWRKPVVMICVRVVVYGVLLWLALRWLEGRMTFAPTRPWEVDLDAVTPPVEEIAFAAEDGVRLSAVWLPHSTPKGVVVMCHGNAGNISHRFGIAEEWRNLGYSILLFDYRGYGKSAGRPTEAGLILDARAAYHEARLRGGTTPIVAGRSLGTVPAIRLAAELTTRGLLLDSPLASAAEMARQILPIPGLPRLLSIRLDNLESIRHVRCPILILHGVDDEVIPFDQGRQVFDAAPEPKQFVPLLDTGHNDSRESPRVLAAIARFWASLPE
ncbi:MAG: alpha/beta hydrolase [Planctomycetota bacterium]